MLLLLFVLLLFCSPQLRRTLWLLISKLGFYIGFLISLIFSSLPALFNALTIIFSFIVGLLACLVEAIDKLFGSINSKIDK